MGDNGGRHIGQGREGGTAAKAGKENRCDKMKCRGSIWGDSDRRGERVRREGQRTRKGGRSDGAETGKESNMSIIIIISSSISIIRIIISSSGKGRSDGAEAGMERRLGRRVT